MNYKFYANEGHYESYRVEMGWHSGKDYGFDSRKAVITGKKVVYESQGEHNGIAEDDLVVLPGMDKEVKVLTVAKRFGEDPGYDVLIDHFIEHKEKSIKNEESYKEGRLKKIDEELKEKSAELNKVEKELSAKKARWFR